MILWIIAGWIAVSQACADAPQYTDSEHSNSVPAVTLASGLERLSSKPLKRGTTSSSSLLVCSFNIQFLGMFQSRDNEGLAELVKGYDIVVIQELVAPPYSGTFPNGDPFNPDSESAVFFNAMKQRGFDYVLSPEDTGSGDRIHLNSSATEWWVAFYKPGKVVPATDLPGGFVATDRSNNDDYERVPYAFPFRTKRGGADFVLISVHLQPDSGNANAARRKHEIASIVKWVESQNSSEGDYLILGDTNIQSKAELNSTLPQGWGSLNAECRSTNTNPNTPKPYDQVFYRAPKSDKEIDGVFGFEVINLAEEMKDRWPHFSSSVYPGKPYVHDKFRTAYSDHNPVVFKIVDDGRDDD
jgi:hypothetical protein